MESVITGERTSMDQLVQSDLAMDARPVVGIWLSDEPVQGSVESLLL